MQMIKDFQQQPTRSSGFTLIEIAISLTVIAFLMAGAISMLRIQNDRTRFSETKTALDEATQALLGFASANGYLPCPASPTESDKDLFGKSIVGGCSSGTTAARGILPWKDLGINGTDGWNQYLSYEVTRVLTTAPTARKTSFYLDTPGKIDLLDAPAGARVVSGGSVAFATWSHGPNGHYGISFQRVPQPPSDNPSIPANPDETANSPTGSGILVSHDEVMNTASPQKNFDDRFVWMSRFLLFRSISNAGYCIPQSLSIDTCGDSGTGSSSSSSSGSSSGAGSSSSGGSSTSSSGG